MGWSGIGEVEAAKVAAVTANNLGVILAARPGHKRQGQAS
jgi:hypothetical protein